jgi:release factor glutamine methyltransferase
MLISEALALARQNLQQQGIDSYWIDVLLLLCCCLSCTKEQVIFNSNLTINPEQQKKFFDLIKRRGNKEPLSHLVGKREFFGNDFIVSNNVLDPRPDSETLISYVLEYFVNKNIDLNILELGVGSGCLLLTILSHFPNSNGVGADISHLALDIAKKNAESLFLLNRIELLQSDWFVNLPLEKKFDLIISNPPYIKTNDIKFLQEEVRIFEPILALDGGKNGLDCYLLIAKNAIFYLKNNGILVLEIGQNQEKEVIKIFNNAGLKFVANKKDLSSIVRCLVFKKQNYEDIS